MTKVIFAIDDGSDLHVRAKFNRYLDTLRVMGKADGEIRIGVGHWIDDDGVSWLEDCYCMDMQDFKKHIQPNGWCNGQQCVLVTDLISSWLAAPNDLHLAIKSGETMHCHGKQMPSGDWTLFHDTGEYWKVEL